MAATIATPAGGTPALRTAAVPAAPAGETPALRPPWPLLPAALLSFLALGISARAFATMPFLALLVLAAWFFETRLENGRWPLWVARALLFAAIFFALGWQRSMMPPGYMPYDTRFVYPFGQLCAAELVIQCWKKRPAGGPRALGVLLLSTIVFACATDTYDDHFIPYLAAAYFVCAGLTLADLRGSRARGLALLLSALCLGGIMRHAMHVHRDALMAWGTRLLQRADLGETIGLSETPTLGPTKLAARSNTRVLRMEGACAEMHLRALAFDTYARGTWGPALSQRELVPVSPAHLRFAEPGQPLRITRLVERSRFLFAPLHCVGVAPAADSRLWWDRRLRAPIITEESSLEPYSYDVILSLNAHQQGLLCAPLSEDERRRCLATPDGSDKQSQRYPLVRELAQCIGGKLRNPLDRVQAVVDHLSQSHEYSLTCDPGAGDPVANFILDGKAAHCEYFASAAVVLLRCLGVPTRYVTGYLAHESTGPGKMVVRGRDAHAWAESWIEGIGWITVEATPPSGVPPALQPVSSLVLSSEWLEDCWERAVAWFSSLSWMQLLGRSVAAAVACAILIRFGGKALRWRWHRRRPATSAAALYSAPDETLRALAWRFEELLRRAGAPCPTHRTWQEHLAALAGPSLSSRLDFEHAEAFLGQYNAARFGAPNDGTATRRLQAALDRLESARHRAIDRRSEE